MTETNKAWGGDALINALRETLERQLHKVATDKAEQMAEQYSKFIREQFASIATSAGLELSKLVSMERYGEILRIELRIQETK